MKELDPLNNDPQPQITRMGDGFQLHQAQRFDQPIDQMFDFFADPHNLEKITPPQLGFSIESCEDNPVEIGTRIHYTLSLHGMPINWTTRIKDFEKNEYFVDEMVEGPYKVWEHIHTFERVQDDTVVGDQVYYEMPYGVLGTLAHKLMVKRDLLTIFSYRAKTLRAEFGSEKEVS
ncbi:MAG: SRPBCC family protein [bacterium]